MISGNGSAPPGRGSTPITGDRIVLCNDGSPFDGYREAPGHVRHLVNHVDVPVQRIWQRLVTRLPINATTVLLAHELVDHWPTITPSRDTLCASARLNPERLQYATQALEAAGLLEVTRRRGSRSEYHLCWPSRLVTAGEWADIHKRRTPSTDFTKSGAPGGTGHLDVVPPGEQVGGSPGGTTLYPRGNAKVLGVTSQVEGEDQVPDRRYESRLARQKRWAKEGRGQG